MPVNGVNPVSQPTAQQLASQAKEAMKAAPAEAAPKPAPKDRVDLSSRNPANKKELMATYTKLRSQQANMTDRAILSGGKVSLTVAPAVRLDTGSNFASGTAPVAADMKLSDAAALREKLMAAREEYKNVVQGPQAYSTANRYSDVVQISQDKKLANAETFRVFVQDTKALAQNTVQGPRGFGSRGNAAALIGTNNQIDITGTPAAGQSRASFELTGGGGIVNNIVAVAGNANAVQFTGSMQKNNDLAVTGNNNSVSLGNGVSGADVDVTGNNVTVAMGGDNPLTDNQSGWTVSVNASNVNVTIQDGRARVTEGTTGALEGMTVEVDNANRTVKIYAADQASGHAVVPPAPNPFEEFGI